MGWLAIALMFVAGRANAYTSVWVTPWDRFTAENWQCFDEINPFVLAFDGRNAVFNAYPRLLEQSAAAKPPGTKLVPAIVNDVFSKDGKGIQTLKSVPILAYWLGDERRLEQHVEDLAAIADNYDGIEIDYEKIPDGLWENYTRFLVKLGERLRPSGKVLAVDVEAGPLYRKGGVIAAKYWPRIARATDKIKIMGYYERGDFSDQVGPGTSAEWIAETTRRALAILPPEKVSMALSLAATDWEVPLPRAQFKRRVKRVHYRQLQQMLSRPEVRPLWDDAFGSPYFRYEKNGRKHEVWYEDERSLGRKIDTAREAGIGVSLWYLGAVRPDLEKLGLCRQR